MTEAFPLHWPPGRPRTKVPQSSRFKVTFSKARQELAWEIDRLGAENAVLSTNIPLRLDGQPMANRTEPADSGVALYFEYSGRSMCFACDRWDKVRDNIRAIFLTIQALRGLERWGTGDMMQAAFTGFEALAPPESCWDVLGIERTRNAEAISQAFRHKAREAHPDHGGSTERMQRVTAARDQAYQEAGLR